MITLPTPSPQRLSALNYQGAKVPDVYSHSNIQAPEAANTGLKAVGGALAKGAEIVQNAKETQDKYDLAVAKSQYLKNSVDLNASLNDNDYTTYDKRFTEGSKKLKADALSNIKNPQLRDFAALDFDNEFYRGRAEVLQKAKAKEIDNGKAYLLSERESAKNTALNSSPDQAGKIISSYGNLIDASRDKGYISATDAVKERQDFAGSYGENWAKMQPADKLLNIISKPRDVASPKDIINSTIAIEGGYSASDGASKAPVIYGINQKYHPEEFAKARELTDTKGAEAGKQYAQEFYKKEYFDKYDIGQFKPDVQQVLFDGVINHSESFSKKLVAAATQGKNASDLVEMRRAEYQRLGKNPAYAESLPGWMNRLDKVRGVIGNTGTPFDFVPADKKLQIRNEVVKNTLTTVIENDPLSAIDQLKSGKFDNILLSSEKAGYEQKARAEAVTQNNQKMNEPTAFAMRKGYIQPEQLDYKSPEMLSQQIAKRLPVIYAMNQKFGSPLEPLTKDEAAGVAKQLSESTASERLGYLKSLRDSSQNDETYRTVLNQIRPNSPVTAWAGSYLDLDRTITVDNWFTKDETIEPQKVAERLTRGEELINPGKEGVKAKMPMPTKKDFGPDFNDYAGSVYKDFPDSASEAYQATVAYYASLSAEDGDYSGTFNSERYEKALEQTLGKVEAVNGGDILLPWGMNEDAFLSALQKSFTDNAARQGLKNWHFDDVDFKNTGISGMYQAYNGTSPLLDKQGNPLFVNVND